ncbi:hypothetical protein [Amycolatopsis sp.]|uniref:hypothetical protein n=1 Tax=Amycolatopsis sp. TaxID=37632 RepID=UPI002BF84FA7|nr:hypothetical protein [Amycolatopsis sp.]HVV12858.1 hypothetical protein [Amycolatopsis sp.]
MAAAEINVQKNKAQATAESQSADLSVSQGENARLKDQNNQLAAENSSLRAQPPSTPSSAQPTGESAGVQSELLSDLTALNTNSVNSPRAVTIGTESYPNSFTLGCSTGGTSVTYAVAGYNWLKARVGLDNNESGSAAKANYPSSIRVTAEDGRQLGDDFQFSLSKPADLSVSLDGAVQVTIKCTLVNPRGTGGYYQAAFGNAMITK